MTNILKKLACAWYFTWDVCDKGTWMLYCIYCTAYIYTAYIEFWILKFWAKYQHSLNLHDRFYYTLIETDRLSLKDLDIFPQCFTEFVLSKKNINIKIFKAGACT